MPDSRIIPEKNFSKLDIILQKECALFSGNSLFFENFELEIQNFKFDFKPLTQIRIWISNFELKLACYDKNAISWGGRWGTKVWTPL